MKLLKKLLPIASVASVAAIVAPIATSCNNGNVIDGSTRFIPTVAQAVADADHAETGYTEPEATQLYFKHVKENPEVFVQDVKATLSAIAYTQVHRSSSYSAMPEFGIEMNYSNFVVDTTADAESMSFEVQGSIHMKNVSLMNDADITNIEIKATKIPYKVIWNSDSFSTQGWNVETPILESGKLSEGQSFEIKVSGKTFGVSPNQWYSFDNETIVLDKEHSLSDTFVGKWYDVANLVLLGTNVCGMGGMETSYHMANIKYNPA